MPLVPPVTTTTLLLYLFILSSGLFRWVSDDEDTSGTMVQKDSNYATYRSIKGTMRRQCVPI
jgi:hypothetical protein